MFIVVMITAVPVGAHGTVVGVCLANLILIAVFWYNLVRSVDVTADGTLRFFIGNVEADIPFDKIVSIRRIGTNWPCNLIVTTQPYRGFLSIPSDGVAISTTLPSTPFFMWPRSAGKPERMFCFCWACPRLTIVFSPMGGGSNFIRHVENEMRNFSQVGSIRASIGGGNAFSRVGNPDYLDV
jgi:hypothetical protein